MRKPFAHRQRIWRGSRSAAEATSRERMHESWLAADGASVMLCVLAALAGEVEDADLLGPDDKPMADPEGWRQGHREQLASHVNDLHRHWALMRRVGRTKIGHNDPCRAAVACVRRPRATGRFYEGMRSAREYSTSSLISLLVGFTLVLVWTLGCGGHGRDPSTAPDASAADGAAPSDAQGRTDRIAPASDAEADAAADAAEASLTFPPCPYGCCESNPADLSCKTDCNQCIRPCAAPACNATTCPMGCCDTHGQCISTGLDSQTACGACGATCVDCTVGGGFPGAFCQNGQCDGRHG
jgi:hypothetical protein